MALAFYEQTIFQSGSGRAYSGVRVQAFTGGSPVQLYRDQAGTQPALQITSDSNGYLSFWVEEGDYDLRYSLGGATLPESPGLVPIYNLARNVDLASSSGANAIGTAGGPLNTVLDAISGQLVELRGANGAAFVPYSDSVGYPNGSVGQIIKTIRLRNPIDPRDFGAGGAGSTNDTAAMQQALTLSKTSNRPVWLQGVFRIDGTLDPAGATIVASNQYSRESVTVADWGGVIQHNNSTGPLFSPSAGGFVLEGIVIHDPNQPGGAPVVRPPVFSVTGTNHATDVTIDSCAIVNSYDLVYCGPSSIVGDWRLTNNRGYLVRYVFDCQGDIPEVIISSDNLWSPGVWQAGAIGVNSGQLAKWTALNGAIWHVNCNSMKVEGIKSDNEFVYGYFSHVYVESGLLNVSTFSGYSWDQVAQPIRTAGNGGIVLSAKGSAKAYCAPYGDQVSGYAAVYLRGTGVTNLDLDFQGQFCSGKWLDINTISSGRIGIYGSLENWGMGTGVTNQNCADIQAANMHLDFEPAIVRSVKTDQNGLNIADIKTMRSRSTFVSCVRSHTIGTCPSAFALVDDSLVVQTGAANSYTNAAGAKFTARGVYDKP